MVHCPLPSSHYPIADWPLPVADRLCITTILIAFAHDDIQFDQSIELATDIDGSNGTT